MRRLDTSLRDHGILLGVLPLAAFVAVDSLAGGEWTIVEAVVGCGELLLLGVVVGATFLDFGRDRWPITVCLAMGIAVGLLAGTVDRPLMPATRDGLVSAEPWRRCSS